jgi:hypothetical protein
VEVRHVAFLAFPPRLPSSTAAFFHWPSSIERFVGQGADGLIVVALFFNSSRTVKLGGVDKFEPISRGGEMDHAEEVLAS